MSSSELQGSSDPLWAPSVTPEGLLASMPARVREAFPAFDWSVEALWQLVLPEEELPVETFNWLLDLPVWRWQGTRFQLSMADVLSNSGLYQAHIDKAEATDTTYPIHITWHRGRWVILDGYHRLLKTLIQGGRTIMVVKVRAEDLEPT